MLVGNYSMERVSLVPVRNLLLFQNMTMKVVPLQSTIKTDYAGIWILKWQI